LLRLEDFYSQNQPPLPDRQHLPEGRAHYRVWNRRGYHMNILSDKKISEKLDYMHNNPAVSGLVAQPGDWPCSSWRYYYLEDRSVLAMDRMP